MNRLAGFAVGVRAFVPALLLICAAAGLWLMRGLAVTRNVPLLPEKAATAQAQEQFAAEFANTDVYLAVEGENQALPETGTLPRPWTYAVLAVSALILAGLSGRSWADGLVLLISVMVSLLLSGGLLAVLGTAYTPAALLCSALMQAVVLCGWTTALLRTWAQERLRQEHKAQAMRQALALLAGTMLCSALTAAVAPCLMLLLPFPAIRQVGAAMAVGLSCTLLTGLFFLPAAALTLSKPIHLLRHWSLAPQLRGAARLAVRRGVALPLCALLILLAACPAALYAANGTETTTGADMFAALLPEESSADAALSCILDAGGGLVTPVAAAPAAVSVQETPQPPRWTAKELADTLSLQPDEADLLWQELGAQPEQALVSTDVLNYALDCDFFGRCARTQAQALSDAYEATRRYTRMYTMAQAAEAFGLTAADVCRIACAVYGSRLDGASVQRAALTLCLAQNGYPVAEDALATAQRVSTGTAGPDDASYLDSITFHAAMQTYGLTEPDACAIFYLAGCPEAAALTISGRALVKYQYEQQRLLASSEDYHAMLAAYERVGLSGIMARSPLYDEATARSILTYFGVNPDTGEIYVYNLLRYTVKNELAEQRGKALTQLAEQTRNALEQSLSGQTPQTQDNPTEAILSPSGKLLCIPLRVTGSAAQVEQAVTAVGTALAAQYETVCLTGPAARQAELAAALPAALRLQVVCWLGTELILLGLLTGRAGRALLLWVCIQACATLPVAVLALCGAALPQTDVLACLCALLQALGAAACLPEARLYGRLYGTLTRREAARRTLAACAPSTFAALLLTAVAGILLLRQQLECGALLLTGTGVLAVCALFVLPMLLARLSRPARQTERTSV